MKKFLAIVLIASLIGISGTASAAKKWDDMSWWGKTGATPDPVKDSKGRAGCWWWPKTAKSNVDDNELWGNRGIVYHIMAEAKKEEPAPPVTPPPTPPPAPPKVERTAIILNNVLFDFDKSILKPEGKVEVDKLVAEMKAHAGDKVLIEGHTCDIGTDEYNMGLGQRRADSVKAYMVESGVATARIEAKSFGETKPAVPNNSEANRKLNRRAEFKITLGE